MLSKYSVKRPFTVLVGVVMVVVLGIVSLSKMTADLLPNMSFPYVMVITTDIGASPEEVETQVTSVIESSLATTSNIKSVNSMSFNSYSAVILEYEQNANMDSILIEIQQKLDQLEGVFDDSVGTPMVMQIDPDMMPVMIAAADIEGMDNVEASHYVETEIIPRLESIDGIASVTASGGIEENIQITLNQDKIDQLNKKITAEIDKKFEDAQAEMDDAKSQIESGQSGLESGQNQMADQISSAKTELDGKKIELYQTEKDLEEQLASLQANAADLQNSIAALQKAYDGAKALQDGIDQMEQLISLADQGMLPADQFAAQTGMDIDTAKQQLEGMKQQLEEINSQLKEQGKDMSDLGVTINSYEDLPAAVGVLTEALAKVNLGITTVQNAQEQIASGKVTIDEALTALNKSEILGTIELSSASAQLQSGSASLEEAQQTLDDSKEQAYESADLNNVLTLDTVKNLLTAQNFAMPAGYINEENGQYLVKVGDKVDNIDDLSDLVLIDLGMDSVGEIKLSDIADVELVDNSAEVYAKINGNSAILLTFEKQTGYSTGDVADSVLERFESIEKEQGNVHMSVLMNQGVYIDMIVDSVIQNMLLGALLAIIVLLLFLKDGRPTLIIACAIPLSVIFAVVLMYFTGITLNVISMSGLALGIGMLVDNSIVVIENIYRLRNEGMSIKKAAVYGASQVGGAITASTLTTICVFAPIIFTDGITRQLFVDMGLTIAYTLVASLIVALTLVPAMSSGMLKKASDKKHPFLDKIQNGYGNLLGKMLRFKPIVFIVVLALLIASVALAMSRGTAFMPEMTSTQLTVTLSPPEDTKKELSEMTEMSDEVVERLMEIPEIQTVGAMSGSGSTMGMMSGGSDNTITMYVLLDEDTKASNNEMIDKITEAASGLDCEVKVDASIMDMSAMSGSGISVHIKGRDLEKMQDIARDVADILENTEGTVDVEDGLSDMTNELVISVDKEKAAEYNMTVAQVFQLVYSKMAATTAATVISTDVKDYDVYLQSDEQTEMTLEELKKLTFTYTDKESGEEEEIPLSRIAEFRETQELSSIMRSSQTRYITVSAGIDENHNVGLVGDEIQKALDKYECPEGYAVEMAGENETINDAMEQVLLMLLLAVILIYLIMVAQFQSLLSPFIIMFTIPLAFTGGFLALYFSGNEVSVIGMIGFVMLAGIIVNNGIVMIDYIIQMRREGMSKKEAIVEAAKTRLRPVLMTALTTIISMSTMAIGMGNGTELMQPMAIVVVGGMVYGTLLTLIVVPCIYDAFNREKNLVEEEL